MSIRIIRTGRDPVLKQKAKPVEKINRAVEKLLDDMTQTMYDAEGIGLAANQIGILKRLVVCDVGNGLLQMINPEIVWASEEKDTTYEACLSLPGLRGMVPRHSNIRFRYINRDGEEHTVEADQLFARCIQHEIDHLDGILFTDYLQPDEVERIVAKESSSQ